MSLKKTKKLNAVLVSEALFHRVTASAHRSGRKIADQVRLLLQRGLDAERGDDLAAFMAEVRRRLADLEQDRRYNPPFIRESPPAEPGHQPDPASLASALAMIPLLDVKLAAGAGAVEATEHVLDHLAFKRLWIKATLRCNVADLRLLTVTGDSMLPTLQDGDLVLLDLSKRKVSPGAIYAIVDGDERLVKRLAAKAEDRLEIRSDNQAYPPRLARREDVQIIGKVVWVAGRRV